MSNLSVSITSNIMFSLFTGDRIFGMEIGTVDFTDFSISRGWMDDGLLDGWIVGWMGDVLVDG